MASSSSVLTSSTSSCTIFKFNVPNMTSCASATISWEYSGQPEELSFLVHSTSDWSEELSLHTRAESKTYTWRSVNLPAGEYIVSAILRNTPADNATFVVDGTDRSCLVAPLSPPQRVFPRRAGALSTRSSSSSNKAATYGGIGAAVGVLVLAVAGLFYHYRRRRPVRPRPMEGQPHLTNFEDEKWGGTISSRDTMLKRSVSPMSFQSDSASRASQPRLEPNRRRSALSLGVSATSLNSDAEDPTPLARLQPNRRAPSLAPSVAPSLVPSTVASITPSLTPSITTLVLDAREPPPATLDSPTLPSALPPLGVSPPSTPAPAVTADFLPILDIAKPVPIIKATPQDLPKLAVPGLRPTSASASTGPSDMPLLRPNRHSTRSLSRIETHRALALAKLDAVVSRPPLPPLPPLPRFSPLRSPPSVSPSQESHPAHTSGASSARTSHRTPTTPGSRRSSRRPNWLGFDPSDIASSIWTRFSTASSGWNNGRGSPVPSSSTSVMYRARDSTWSEWTWTRPIEEWEREQGNMKVAKAKQDGTTEAQTHAAEGSAIGSGRRPILDDIPEVPPFLHL